MEHFILLTKEQADKLRGVYHGFGIEPIEAEEGWILPGKLTEIPEVKKVLDDFKALENVDAFEIINQISPIIKDDELV